MDIAYEALKLFPIAQLEKPNDFGVLFIRFAQKVTQFALIDVGVLAFHEISIHLVDEALQTRIAALAHIAFVEIVLQVIVFLIEAFFDGKMHGAMKELQLSDIVFGHSVDGKQSGTTIERSDNLNDFPRAFLSHALDVKALARNVLEIAMGGKLDERLAHRGAAHPERIAYLLLADLMVIGKRAAVDEVSNMVIHMIFKRSVFVRHFIRLSYGYNV